MADIIYKSEDGQYLCRMRRPGCDFEAWTKDGSIHWRDDDRMRTRDDERIKPLQYAVGSYSAEHIDQKPGSFSLGLLHCDTDKHIDPFTGNTVIESRDVVFRRRVPPQNIPRWLREQIAADSPAP